MKLSDDVGATVRQVAEDFQKLRSAYDKNDNKTCLSLLNGIQKKLVLLPTYLNPAGKSRTRREELTLTREVLELAVLFAARIQDLGKFEFFFSQLNVYYTDIGLNELPESPYYLMILGLNLVRLLVCSHIAQFHSELEKIPKHIHGSNRYIRFPVLLERQLMEGSYYKLLNSRHQAPADEFIPVVTMLESTVRQEVAQCISRSYTTLSLKGAQKVLMVDSEEEVKRVGRENGWKLDSTGKEFSFTHEEEVAKEEVPFWDMLGYHIHFAAELQRIV